MVAPLLMFIGASITWWPRAVNIVEIEPARAAESFLADESIESFAKPEAQELSKIINDFVAKQSVPYGIVVKDLKTGVSANINPEKVFTSASLYKLYVANQIYREIDAGKRKLSDRSGVDGYNLGECLEIMINISDNNCGSTLGNSLGWQAQATSLADQGFRQTNLQKPLKTSARDTGILLSKLYQRLNLEPQSTSQFLDFLKEQRINNRLPQGLPSGTVIAHKTGDLDGYMHDAGIVYGPKTDYLVVVLSGPWPNQAKSYQAFADLSAQLWHFFQD